MDWGSCLTDCRLFTIVDRLYSAIHSLCTATRATILGRTQRLGSEAGQITVETRRQCELPESNGHNINIHSTYVYTSGAAARIKQQAAIQHQDQQGARSKNPAQTNRDGGSSGKRKRASVFEAHDDQEWTPGKSPEKRLCRRPKSRIAKGQKKTESTTTRQQRDIDVQSLKRERDRDRARLDRLEVEKNTLEETLQALEVHHETERNQFIARQTELNDTILRLRQERSQQTTIIPSSTRSDFEHGQSLLALNAAIDSFAFQLFRSKAIAALQQGKPFGIRQLIVGVLDARIMSSFCPGLNKDAQLCEIYNEIDPQRQSILNLALILNANTS